MQTSRTWRIIATIPALVEELRLSYGGGYGKRNLASSQFLQIKRSCAKVDILTQLLAL